MKQLEESNMCENPLVTACLTRRSWAALLATAPLAAQVATTAQNPPPPAAPVAAISEQRLAKAAEDVHQFSQRLAQTEVPMAIEPAFSFHV